MTELPTEVPTEVPAQPATPSWSTPQILKTGFAAICIASLLLMVAAIAGARSHREAMQVVGRNAAPHMIAAQRVRSALAAMDVDATNELLSPRDANTARHAFEQRRTEAVSAILAAAENIFQGDAERTLIQTLALGVATYTAEIQTARDRREAGDKTFLAAWREASKFMDSTLVPATEALGKTNSDAMDAAYVAEDAVAARSQIFLLLAAVAVGGVLFLVQAFLLLRMRRIFNPMLFLATLTALIFVIYTGQHFAGSGRDLKAIKEDAFASIDTLWQARTLAYSANVDQSRALLDAAQRLVYERSFREKADRIGRWPVNATEPDTLEARGLLAIKLGTLHSEEEREAAADAASRFFEYRNIDRQVQTLEDSGRRDAAITLDTGEAANQAAGAFMRFDGALGRTLDVDRKAFDAAVERGFSDVAGFEITAPVMAALISLLSWLGVRPRIREYM